jgi:hypothetical protein
MPCSAWDISFEFLHVFVIGFNVFAWLFRRLRFVHFCLVNITMFSWVGLGFFYGFGYCFLVDWHWSIKNACGVYDLPSSYLLYFLNQYFGFYPDSFYVDFVTAIVFCLVYVISWYLFCKQKLAEQ